MLRNLNYNNTMDCQRITPRTYYLILVFLGLCGSCIYFSLRPTDGSSVVGGVSNPLAIEIPPSPPKPVDDVDFDVKPSATYQSIDAARHAAAATLNYTATQTTSPLDRCRNEHLYNGSLAGAGFAMALDYSDQQTGGGMNLFCLQCIAYSIDPSLVVVEPFLVRSTFGASMYLRDSSSETPWKNNEVRMSDVYSMEKWLQYSREKCFAPLVSWEKFLSVAPRDVVLVKHSWDKCTLDKFLDKFQDMYAPFLQLYQFHVVRKVCFHFKSSGQLALWRYKHSLYGDLDPRNVTVIYERWFEVAHSVSKFTVSISDSYCHKSKIGNPLFNEHVTSSEKLSTQAELYVSRFLGGVTDHLYIAVMLRIERVLLGMRSSKRMNRLSLVSRCLDNLIKKWEYMKRTTGITLTFLALDYGKYGSKGNWQDMYVDERPLEEKLIKLLHTMNQGNFSQWESQFAEVAGTRNPGYIGALQKTIASRARCLITIGGGTFQHHAYMMHKAHFGDTCSIQLRDNCNLLDSFVKFSLPATKD